MITVWSCQGLPVGAEPIADELAVATEMLARFPARPTGPAGGESTAVVVSGGNLTRAPTKRVVASLDLQ
jgi:hypothetical protein